jgi:hypothetical protein
MSDIIMSKFLTVWNYLFEKGGIIFSFVLTVFLTAIGYPKGVITFIIALVIVDILTRWYSEVHKHYKEFTLKTFYVAWKDGILSSKKLKQGLFTKIFFYAILLYFAHQTSVIPELGFGVIISNFIYSVIIILDMISVFENMIQAGFTKVRPILNMLERKKDEMFNENMVTKNEEEI